MWFMPSHNRPVQCKEVLERLAALGCSTPGVVLANGGRVEEYGGQAFRALPEGWVLAENAENLGFSGGLNLLFRTFPDEPWYGFIADDEFPLTHGFDKILVEAAGAWNVAHGDDGVNGGRRAQGVVCLGGDLVRAVGYLALGECWHWYAFDDLWEMLGKDGVCRRKFMPEVKVDHRHPLHGKGRRDATYAEGERRAAQDFQAFGRWSRGDRHAARVRVAVARQRAEAGHGA